MFPRRRYVRSVAICGRIPWIRANESREKGVLCHEVDQILGCCDFDIESEFCGASGLDYPIGRRKKLRMFGRFPPRLLPADHPSCRGNPPGQFRGRIVLLLQAQVLCICPQVLRTGPSMLHPDGNVLQACGQVLQTGRPLLRWMCAAAEVLQSLPRVVFDLLQVPDAIVLLPAQVLPAGSL